MFRERSYRFILVLILICSNFLTKAQDTWEVHPLKERWSVGVTAGNLLFYGDVAEFQYPWEKDMSEYKWAFGLVFRKDITPAIFLQGQGLNGTITGLREKYSDGVIADEQFKCNMFEYNLCTKVNFYRLIKNSPTRLAIYGLGGIGMVHYRSQMKNLTTDAVVRYVGYDANGKKTSMESDLVFPFGLGVGYAISKKLNLNFDATYRYTSSDLLDSREGQTDVNDMYGYTSVGLVYKLGFQKTKPKPYNDGPDYIADDYNTDYDDAYEYNDEQNNDSTIVADNNLDNNTTTVDNETYTDNETYNNYSNIDTVSNTVADTYTDNNDVYNNNSSNENNSNYVTDNTDPYNNTVNENNTNTNITPYTNTNDNNSNTNTYTPPTTTTYTDGLSFKVQIAASYNKPMSTAELSQEYSIDKPITEDKIGNWYKYTVGDFKDKNDANTLRKELTANNGVKGAFLAPYNYGARIEQSEALAIMSKRNSNTGSYSGTSSSTFLNPRNVVSTNTNPVITGKGIFYGVQVAASRNPLSNSYIQNELSVSTPIYEDYVDGWYKYSVGVYGNFEEANQLKRQLRNNKVEGAFVIAYQNQNRIDANTARKLETGNTGIGYVPTNTYNTPSYSNSIFNDASTVVSSSTNAQISQNKIYYTVQVAASKQSLTKEFFSRKYGITEPLFKDYVEGWHKYSVGVFDNFKAANSYRKKIIKEKGVKGAFVAAYHYDKRIPQQEARKISRNR